MLDFDVVKPEIKRYALATPEIECCGLITEKDNLLKVFPCENIAINKRNQFKIKEKDYLRASLNGKIKATYHSHLNEENFSITDRVNCYLSGYIYLLYIIEKNFFKLLNPENTFSYLNKEFILGRNDCYHLVKEFYQTEKNIFLPEISNYDQINDQFISDLASEHHLQIETDVNQIQSGDIIVFNLLGENKLPHFAIFLGNGYILHHPRNGYSQINLLTPALFKKYKYFLRCLN